MNRHTIFNLGAVTVMGLALLPDSAISQQKSFKEQLVGSWAIVSNDNVAPDGTKRQIFGPNPKGIFILGADGCFALVVVNPAVGFALNPRTNRLQPPRFLGGTEPALSPNIDRRIAFAVSSLTLCVISAVLRHCTV